MNVCIIDCGAGNLHSVEKSFRHVAASTGHTIAITTAPDEVHQADAIVLPGVGAFADCMQGLLKCEGMREALESAVLKKHTPFLGICVGMQMLFERGLEHGTHTGLGWLKGDVVPIEPQDAHYKIPHMGWNELQLARPEHPLLRGINNGDHVYFVHSFHARCGAQEDVLACAEYGGMLTAAVAKNNVMGTQFHPEKSQETGLCIIRNFLTMPPMAT